MRCILRGHCPPTPARLGRTLRKAESARVRKSQGPRVLPCVESRQRKDREVDGRGEGKGNGRHRREPRAHGGLSRALLAQHAQAQTSIPVLPKRWRSPLNLGLRNLGQRDLRNLGQRDRKFEVISSYTEGSRPSWARRLCLKK